MKKGEITQLTEYIDSGKEETVVTEKVEVPEIRFASTDIRYRKQQVPVDSEKVKKPDVKFGSTHKRSHNLKKINLK